MKISRRKLLAGLAGAGVSTAALSAARRIRPPNVVFIMADDLGAHDLSCYGRPDYKTPQIDKLGADGLTLDQAYANSPTCSPTRTALISGQYQYRYPVGVYDPLPRGNRDIGYPASAQSLPRLFSKAGYQTALIGKWHLGPLPSYGPLRSGYHEFFGPMESAMDYVNHRPMGAGPSAPSMLFQGEENVEVSGYATDLFSDRACALIRRWRRDPFFLSLHYTAPHFPWQAPQDSPTDERVTGNHDAGSHSVYAQMVAALDTGVGRVLKELERQGLDEDTIVVFTSDNGGERYSYQFPLRGSKSELWEGGIRVPAIIRWRGRLPRTRSRLPVMTMDWVPTLLALANLKTDDAVVFDGVNLKAAMQDSASHPSRAMFWRTHDMAAMRLGSWKYVREDQREYLFDLSTDPGERANLRRRKGDIAAAMRDQFDQWNLDMIPVPEDAKRPRVMLRQEFEALNRP